LGEYLLPVLRTRILFHQAVHFSVKAYGLPGLRGGGVFLQDADLFLERFRSIAYYPDKVNRE
jgi:hypothetical protein